MFVGATTIDLYFEWDANVHNINDLPILGEPHIIFALSKPIAFNTASVWPGLSAHIIWLSV